MLIIPTSLNYKPSEITNASINTIILFKSQTKNKL